MSNTIDKKVVEMEFNNQNFERNVATTMNTVDKLKGSLNFSGAAKGLDELNGSINNTNFAPMSSAIDGITQKFSVWEQIAVGALRRLGEQALDTGEKFVKSLTVDNVAEGWKKFGDKTQSVATLVNQGYAIEEVNEQMNKLNWFTDETSYNFTAMANEIGKFTASGQGLEDSVTAMMGIANWAALSGQNASKASSAMYQLSQAMSKGSLRLDDWKSIQNVGMDTKEFRENAVNAAIALGQVRQNAEGLYQVVTELDDGTIKLSEAMDLNTMFTSEGLTKTNWLDTDVMMSVFTQYGKAANALKAITDETGGTASEVMQDLEDKAEELVKEMNAAGQEITLDDALKKVSFDAVRDIDSVKEAANDYIDKIKETEDRTIDFDTALEEMGYGLDSFALKALRSAQEARSWGDVVDAVKDAVSTGWMNMFEVVFGQYDEAKELWTNLANELWEIFAGGFGDKVDLLKEWKELGGRDLLFNYGEDGSENLGALWNLLYGIEDILGSIKDAWTSVFGETTAQTLMSVTKAISDFFSKIRLSDEQLGKLTTAFKGLFAIADIVFSAFKAAKDAIFEVLAYIFGKDAESLFNFGEAFGNTLMAIRDWIKEGEVFQKVFGAVVTVIKFFVDVVRGFVDAIKQLIGTDTSGLDSFTERVSARFQALSEIIGKIGERLKSFVSVFQKIFEFLKPIFDAIGNAINEIFEGIKKSFVDAGKGFSLDSLGNIVEIALGGSILLSINKITKKIGSFGDAVSQFGNSLKKGLRDSLGIGSILDGFKDIFGSLGDTLKAFQNNVKADTLLKIAISMAVLVGSLVILTTIDKDELQTAITGITALFIELMTSFTIITKVSSKKSKMITAATAMIEVALAVLILATAMKKMAGMSWGEIIKSMMSMKMALKTMSKTLNSINTKGAMKKALSMIVLSSSILIIAKGLKSIAEMSGSEIGASLFALSRSMKILPKALNSIDSKGALKKAIAMIPLTTSLVILAEAMKSMAEMSWEEIGKALAAMAISLQLLPRAINSIQSKGSIKKVLSMILMASAMCILGEALKKMGSMSWEEVGKSLIAMGVALAELLVTFKVLEKVKISVKNILMLILASASLLILGSALAKFAELSWDEIARALVAMGVALAEMLAAFAVLEKVKIKIKNIVSLILASASLLILGSALAKFAELSWDQIGRSLVAMGCALAELIIAMKVMEMVKVSLKNVLSLILIAVAMQTLSGALEKLAALSWEGIAKALIAMGVALGAMVLAISIMGKTSQSTMNSIFLLGAVAGTLTGVATAFTMLSKIGWAGVLVGVVALVAVLTTLGIAAKVIGPMAGSLVSLSVSMLAFSVSTLTFGLSLVAIGMGLAAVGTGLALVATGIIALGPAMGPLAEGIQALLPVILQAIKDFIIFGLQTIIEATPLFMEALYTIIVETCKMLADSIKDVLVILDDLIIAVLEELDKSLPKMVETLMLLIITLLDALVEHGPEILDKLFTFLFQVLDALIANIGPLIDKLVDILIEVIYALANRISDVAEATVYLVGELISGVAYVIAGSIGAIIGGIVDGIAKAVADGLPQLGTKLSDFTDNAQPFLDATSDIDEDNLKGAKMLAETILCVVGAELLSGISDFLSIFTGSTSASFGEKIVSFGYSMAGFAEATKGIDGARVQTSANAAKALAEFANALPKEGGLWQDFFGQGNLGKFGTELEEFGPHFAVYAKSVEGIDGASVEASAKAAEALAKFANSLPKEGGLWQELMGSGNLFKFAYNLRDFGPALKEYADSVQGLDANVVVNSANAADALSKMANGLRNHGGIIQEWTGDASLTSFARELSDFAPAFVEYASKIKGIDTGAVEASATAATMIANLENSLRNHGGFAQLFTGDNSLKGFSEELPYLGTGLQEFVTNLGSSFNSQSLTMVNAIINGIIKLCENMGGINVDGFNQFSEMFVSIPQLSVDEFENQFEGASERIKAVATNLIDTFTHAAAEKKDTFKYTFETLVESCEVGISDNNFKITNAGHAFMDSLINALVDKNQTVMTTFENITGNGLRKVDGRKPEFEAAGKNLVEGFINGLNDGQDKASAKMSEIAKAVLDKMREELDIHSPSREMYKIGDFAITGFVDAIADSTKLIYSTSEIAGDTALDGIKDALSAAAETIEMNIDTQPTIKPVIDLSEVNAGAEAINEVFGPDSTIGVSGNISAVMGDISNSSTINVDNSDVVKELNNLRSEMGVMADKLSKFQIYLDTGALVGELSDPMDVALGAKTVRQRRG